MKTLRALSSPILAAALVALLFVVSGARGETARPSPAQTPSPDGAGPADLPALLAKTAGYCLRLENSAFDFVCREEIRETIDPKLDAYAKNNPASSVPTIRTAPGGQGIDFSGPSLIVSTVRKVHRSFVYDYQCIRAGGTIREIRTELEENGKTKNVPNAELKTATVVWGTALFGPVGLFGERFQPNYEYAVVGRETVGGIATVVVDAKPKPGAPATRNLYGKAWIDPATGDILKIEWSESRVGHFDVFSARGSYFKRTPRLTIVSEFSAEKNGLRFPTRLTVEEAYLKDSGKAFVRSRTDVVYKDFKFFTVEVEVH